MNRRRCNVSLHCFLIRAAAAAEATLIVKTLSGDNSGRGEWSSRGHEAHGTGCRLTSGRHNVRSNLAHGQQAGVGTGARIHRVDFIATMNSSFIQRRRHAGLNLTLIRHDSCLSWEIKDILGSALLLQLLQVATSRSISGHTPARSDHRLTRRQIGARHIWQWAHTN